MFGLEMSLPALAALRRADPRFTPARLSGLIGWYDPGDLSTLFQDAAGTVPVTAAGQPVARMLDKSGNGNHLSQASAAACPVFGGASGAGWLDFDGVDDELAAAAPVTTGSNAAAMGAACELLSLPPSGSGALMADANYQNGGMQIGFNTASGSAKWYAVANTASASASYQSGGPATLGAGVFLCSTGPGAFVEVPGLGTVAAPGLAAGYAQPSKALKLGRGTQGGRDRFMNARVHGAVYASVAEGEAEAIRDYLAALLAA